MGLFDKKYCDICGNEIKFLGNRKLDDGNMCKDCAAKLSPWFSGRRHTSVAEIKEQLKYREENQKRLAQFNPKKVIGSYYKVYIDEDRKLFAVSNLSNWRNANPDLLSLSDVSDVHIDVKEDKDEITYKDAEGKQVSYDPKRYEYEYEFNVHIDVNHKFFDDMDFRLSNTRPDSTDSDEYRELVKESDELMMALTGRHFTDDHVSVGTDGPAAEGEWFCPKCGARNNGSFCTKCGTKRPDAFTPFFCSKCGEKITDPGTLFCPKCGNKVQ